MGVASGSLQVHVVVAGSCLLSCKLLLLDFIGVRRMGVGLRSENVLHARVMLTGTRLRGICERQTG